MLIRLLSVNIWDLPITLPGFARQIRRERLLQQLPRADADLVLIQEAFRPTFKHRIAQVLERHQPDDFIAHRGWQLGFPTDGSGGLATFSRFPLARSRFVPSHRWIGMKIDERIGRKGCLWTEVDLGGREILVGNVHLYAGPGARNARVRAKQVRHLVEQLAGMPRVPTIVAGDFNMAIEHEVTNNGPSGFDLMRQAGFVEVASGSSEGLATISPKTNPFARYFPTSLPERRLTQIFWRGDGVRPVEPPRVVLDRPPVSDHFGLTATFEIS